MTKILVIDDDAIVRKTIVQLLEDDGYQVVSTDDGRRGMALFRSERPDLVITDIIMPEQEGIQTRRRCARPSRTRRSSPSPAARASAIWISSRSLKRSAPWTPSRSPSIRA